MSAINNYYKLLNRYFDLNTICAVYDLDINVVKQSSHLRKIFEANPITSNDQQTLKILLNKSILNKQPIGFFYVVKNTQSNPDHIATATIFSFVTQPLFDQYDSLIGVIMTGNTSFGNNQFLNYYHKIINDESASFEDYNLTHRESEVVYLMTQRFSQREIAKILGLSRGTVSHIITFSLTEKLGFRQQNSQQIIKKAIKLGFNHQIPASLVDYGIIECTSNEGPSLYRQKTKI